MLETFRIQGTFPSLNEYSGYDRYKKSHVKQQCDDMVAWSAKAAHIRPFFRPVIYKVTWVEPNHRRDLDNIAFGKKFIQDGLVKAGILANDTHHEIVGFEDRFAYDSKNPHIEVEIREVTNGK